MNRTHKKLLLQGTKVVVEPEEEVKVVVEPEEEVKVVVEPEEEVKVVVEPVVVEPVA